MTQHGPYVRWSTDQKAARWIYFVSCGWRIKVGISQNPLERFTVLQGASPVPLEFLGAMRGSEADEKAVQAKFAHLRRRYEWFDALPELSEFIKQYAIPLPPTDPNAGEWNRRGKRRLPDEEWAGWCGRNPYT